MTKIHNRQSSSDMILSDEFCFFARFINEKKHPKMAILVKTVFLGKIEKIEPKSKFCNLDCIRNDQ